jgi:hypothetical protein
MYLLVSTALFVAAVAIAWRGGARFAAIIAALCFASLVVVSLLGPHFGLNSDTWPLWFAALNAVSSYAPQVLAVAIITAFVVPNQFAAGTTSLTGRGLSSNVRLIMTKRARLLGICVAAPVALAAISYLLAFALDWPRLYSNSLQRFPELPPLLAATIQAAFGSFSGPTSLAIAAMVAATSSRRPVLLPLLFLAFAPVHVLGSYALLVAPFGWLAFQLFEVGGLLLIFKANSGPNLPLNLDAPQSGAPVS